MKTKIFALLAVFGFALNLAGATFAGNEKKQTNELVALLPASDGVVTMDSKRFFATALPQILSGNKGMLDEIYEKIDEFKSNTGIDLRQFDQIAVGVAAKKISEKETDYESVALARGNFSADSLVKLAKFASGDKYREEKIGERTVYIFSPKEMIEKNKPTAKNAQLQKILDMMMPRLSGETAITVYDNKTLAFGTPDRLKLMLTESKSRVDTELVALVSRNLEAVMSFAGNMPNGMSGLIQLDDDELGQNIDSIRQIFGSMDVVGENTIVSITAKTSDVKHAEGLQKNISDLREVGKMILGSSKREDQKMYARLLENAKITRNGMEVSLNLQVSQSDMNMLIGTK
ncbi:hypothetical protein BH10ACI1_BH10ACI1_00120 [soil metagenome]